MVGQREIQKNTTVYKIDTIDVDGKPEVRFKCLKRLVGERGFEPPTPWSRKQSTNVDSASLTYQINRKNWLRLAPIFSPNSLALDSNGEITQTVGLPTPSIPRSVARASTGESDAGCDRQP
jgi:hypothetical protein